jgi:imidazoleglycerol-phosphate dehydratase
MERKAEVERTTKETSISVSWDLDGSGEYSISTGIPFFDHMLDLFAKHGLFDLVVTAEGDTEVDNHHTVEDVGIAMGKALRDALGGMVGIKRYGSALVPMDETLCMTAVDISGRSSFIFRGRLQGRTGGFDVDVVREFLQAFVNEARLTLHVNLLYGNNLHHKVEAVFKSFARALRVAVEKDDRIKGVLSTKGLAPAIRVQLRRKMRYLGICLGMQVLFDSSEQAPGVKGLGVIRGNVPRFTGSMKVPHMGWNSITIRKESPILKGVAPGDFFYFVHSYYCAPDDRSVIATTTDYDGPFASSVDTGSLFACQFHPEKSQRVGLTLLKNFLALAEG